MSYSIPYILFICLILTISTFQLGMPLEEKSRKYLNYLVIVAYILFFGFRGFIGWDWHNYYIYYTNIKIDKNLFYNNNYNFDLGFSFYAVLIKHFLIKYDSFVLINTITNIILLSIFLKRYLNHKYFAFGIALFIVFNGLILEIDLMRNVKALLIFLIAIRYIEERKPIKYFALIALAFLFHWSAIFYIPLYFFLHKPVSLKTFLLILIIGNIIFIFQIEYIKYIIKIIGVLLPNMISSKITMYSNNAIFSKSYGFTIGFIERTTISFFILFFYNKISKNPTNILFINSFLIYLCIYLYCSDFSIILQRVAGNFGYSYWILLPMILQNIDKKSKTIFYLFYCVVIIVKVHMMTNIIFYDYQSSLLSRKNSYIEQSRIFNKHQKELFK